MARRCKGMTHTVQWPISFSPRDAGPGGGAVEAVTDQTGRRGCVRPISSSFWAVGVCAKVGGSAVNEHSCSCARPPPRRARRESPPTIARGNLRGSASGCAAAGGRDRHWSSPAHHVSVRLRCGGDASSGAVAHKTPSPTARTVEAVGVRHTHGFARNPHPTTAATMHRGSRARRGRGMTGRGVCPRVCGAACGRASASERSLDGRHRPRARGTAASRFQPHALRRLHRR